jgi:hypothetical protein
MKNWEKDKVLLNEIGVATFDNLDVEAINYLQNLVDNREDLYNYTDKLAGHIKDERGSKITSYFSNYICKLIFDNSITKLHLNAINLLNKDLPLFIEEMWINFQKKHEFNPLHIHTGIFSFIVFIKIPYNLIDEDKFFSNIKDVSIATSRLCFVVCKPDGGITDIKCNVDESYLHKMLIFPANYNHLVYPFFTSNEERITISGNIKFDATSC